MRPSIGLAADVGLGPARLVELAREAEAAGFEGVYMIEDEYDSLAYAQAIAAGTSRVVTGSAVARFYAHHPLITAETAAVIDLLAPGRFVIGIGSEPPRRADQGQPPQRWGIAHEKENARYEEYVEIVRRAFTDDLITLKGDFYWLNRVRVRVKPASAHIPILFGVDKQRIARIAGRLGDGMFIQLLGPAMTQRMVFEARDSAVKARRNPDDLLIGKVVLTCVSNDSHEARRAMRAHLVNCFFNQPRMWQILVEEGYAEVADELRECSPPQEIPGAVDDILADPQTRCAAQALPDEVVDGFAIAGTPAECRKRLDQLAGWGIEEPVLFAVPAKADWDEGCRAVIDAFSSVAKAH